MNTMLRFLSFYTQPPNFTPADYTLPPIASDLTAPPDYTLTPFTMPSTLPPAISIPTFAFNITDIRMQLSASAAALATIVACLAYVTHCLSCTSCVATNNTSHRKRPNKKLKLTPFSS